jgi:hypothetical protein
MNLPEKTTQEAKVSEQSRPKISATVVVSAVAASLLLAWVGYKSGQHELAGARAGLVGKERDDYLKGSIEGVFLIPCLVALVSLIFKRRSTRRVLIVYAVTALIGAVAMLSTFR